MPRPRTAMRKIRDLLRLKFESKLSNRQIRDALGVPLTTVADQLYRAAAAGLSWPLPEDLDDAALEALLFKPVPAASTRPLPDWNRVHQELKRPEVTLALLWVEYKEQNPEGYQYSQFCEHYRRWQRQLDLVLRHEHRAGKKLFVDFAGKRIPIYEPGSERVVLEAEVLVAVLSASNYTYAEALPSQELPHWIAGHVHAFEYFGGTPEIVVPDNLRSGVTKPHRYEADLNRTYEEMAGHYRVAVIPARVYRPRDKAKVEVGVQIVERWIIARLRHRRFYSLGELNVAIRQLLEWLNTRPFKKLEGNRRQLFEDLERPLLRPLPAEPYTFGTWRLARVNIDYHIEVERHYYSVPYQLTHQQVDARFSATTVEVFFKGRRVASHRRSFKKGGFTTDPVHMPAAHRRHLEWTPSRIMNWAKQTGPATAELAHAILESRPHPEQGYRSCMGLIRLGDRYGSERMEAACQRALAARALSCRSVESILKTGLDRQPLTPTPARVHRRHANLRGPAYYR